MTTDLTLEVGQRLREEFANGRTYYPLHGQRLRPPAATRDQPNRDYLVWHNENVYIG